jgi:hypothetical protein
MPQPATRFYRQICDATNAAGGFALSCMALMAAVAVIVWAMS